MSKTTKMKIPCLLLVLAGTAFTNNAFSDEYYRWKGNDGVIHYGARPPEGVEAELVDTWGKSLGDGPAEATEKKTGVDQGSAKDKQKELAVERKQQCEDERARLKTLTKSGTKIRMKQDDGTTRFLSSDELSKEIDMSQKFINQACN